MSYALLCPGQGAQHPDMIRHLQGSAAADSVFSAAGAALGEDVRGYLQQGDRMFDSALAQPLICVSQLATWQALRESLPRPLAIAGYSVGELAAYALADAIDAAELARLARVRAQLMDAAAQTHTGGLMALRGLSRGAVERLCQERGASIAIVTAETAFVLGGCQATLDEVGAEALAHGAEMTCLRVGLASHTPFLAAAVEPFRSALELSSLRAPRVPVVAGIEGSWVRDRARAIDTLSQQIARTVEWTQCLDSLYEHGCRVCLELGPGSALARMMRERHEDVDVRSVEEFGSLSAVRAWLQKRVE